MIIKTEAWVLHQGPYRKKSIQDDFAELHLEKFSFTDIEEYEVLVEPIFGCWEGNMNHALRRRPIDICRQRKEERVVIGNAGVVRVLRPGSSVAELSEGDFCIVFPNAVWDELGFMEKAYAYDAHQTVGVLAKRTKLHYRQLIPIPKGSRRTIEQWAAFSARFTTAWANWKIAYGTWRLLHPKADAGAFPYVWGWGGGVSFAELLLARVKGFPAAMIASQDQRLALIERYGIEPIDRRQFPDLNFRPDAFATDYEYRSSYMRSELRFLEIVAEKTEGKGVSIFVELIGAPVFQATLKSLGRPAVLTSAGWKEGMELHYLRAVECMNWHAYVHTHFARYEDGIEAVAFAEQTGWMPPAEIEKWKWSEVPALARNFYLDQTTSLFPLYEVNPL